MFSIKKNTTLSILLPLQIVLVQFAGKYPAFIETYYSNGVYPIISKFLRVFLGWIPFSFGDVLLGTLLFLFLRFIYRLIKSRFKNVLPKLLSFTAVLSVIYFFFYFFWGLNYYRESLAKNLDLEQSAYTTEELLVLAKKLINKTNELQIAITKSDTAKVINQYQPKEMYKIAIDGYDNLSKTYPQLVYKNKSVKSSLMSLFQSYNGTSGYMNPLTGEAQVNDKIPKTGYPVVTCHEMAHQIGWAAENEANFVGFLAATHNKDMYFKYSGYKMAMRYVIYELYKRDKKLYKEVYKTINKGIKKDIKDGYAFWKKYKNPFEPLIKKGYNAYLKANKQQNGIQSYNYVVDLLVAYYLKETKDI